MWWRGEALVVGGSREIHGASHPSTMLRMVPLPMLRMGRIRSVVPPPAHLLGGLAHLAGAFAHLLGAVRHLVGGFEQLLVGHPLAAGGVAADLTSSR